MKKKEKTMEKKKEKGKKLNKQALMFAGILLVTFGTFLMVFFAGYLGVTYSPLIREYALNLEGQEETETGDKQYVVTESEMNVIEIVEEASYSEVSIAESRLMLYVREGIMTQLLKESEESEE